MATSSRGPDRDLRRLRAEIAPDPQHVLWALRALYPEGAVIELRVPPRSRQQATISGYFNDLELLAQNVVRLDGAGEGIYVTLNLPKPELLARAANRIERQAKQTTSDADILRRINLLIDIDPTRPAGISATEEERRGAHALGFEVARYLLDRGWPAPILGDSGNGCHLFFRIDLPNEDVAAELIEKVLAALAHRFNNEHASIDEKVFNASRIVKVPGSVARKGDDVLPRPHRLARLMDVPEETGLVTREQLEALVEELLPAQPEKGGQPPPRAAKPSDWIEKLCLENGREIISTEPWEGGFKYTLDACPFNLEHRDAAIFRRADGGWGYHCFHKSCEGKAWRDIYRLFQPAARPAPAQGAAAAPAFPEPRILSVADIYANPRTRPPHLVESLLPQDGVTLFVAMPKAGKSVLSAQVALAVAGGGALFSKYGVLRQGPALIIEQDDPCGDLSIKEIYEASKVPVSWPLHFIGKQKHFHLGEELAAWLDSKIRELGLVLIVLDSYTALRPFRNAAQRDIVKVEHEEITLLDELGKRAHCALLFLHHDSHTGGARMWESRGSGSHGITMASEAQWYLERYRELALDSPERILRLQGHSMKSVEMVLRFEKRSMGFHHILEGAGASLYPLLVDISKAFQSTPFDAKEYQNTLGVSRPTAFNHLSKLFRAGALTKSGTRYQLLARLAAEAAAAGEE